MIVLGLYLYNGLEAPSDSRTCDCLIQPDTAHANFIAQCIQPAKVVKITAGPPVNFFSYFLVLVK